MLKCRRINSFFCFMAHATPRGGVGIPLKVAAAPAGTEASLSGMRSHPDITVDDDVSALLHGRRQRLATVLWWRGTASAWCRPSRWHEAAVYETVDTDGTRRMVCLWLSVGAGTLMPGSSSTPTFVP